MLVPTGDGGRRDEKWTDSVPNPWALLGYQEEVEVDGRGDGILTSGFLVILCVEALEQGEGSGEETSTTPGISAEPTNPQHHFLENEVGYRCLSRPIMGCCHRTS